MTAWSNGPYGFPYIDYFANWLILAEGYSIQKPNNKLPIQYRLRYILHFRHYMYRLFEFCAGQGFADGMNFISIPLIIEIKFIPPAKHLYGYQMYCTFIYNQCTLFWWFYFDHMVK